MNGTLIRDENLNTLASKKDVQELADAVLKVEELMMGEKTNSSAINETFSILKFIWKILPVIHLALHLGTIGLLLGIF